MNLDLYIYNSLSRKKEAFKPLFASHVGMYVCGPTVYGEPHLGHARPSITFDIVFRYLQHLGLKVRYVRNITDVGHLVDDADEGEDKIAKKARLDGIVCSGKEAKSVKKICKNMEIITPGIRLKGDKTGDQKRVVTPKQAFRNGATAIVIGRSVTDGNLKKNIKGLIKEIK